MQLLGLINDYYDDLDSKGESKIISNARDQVKDAHKAYFTGRYGANRKQWTEFLPGRAEVMLAHFIDPNRRMDPIMATMIPAMGCSWLMSTGAERRSNSNAAAIAPEAAS